MAKSVPKQHLAAPSATPDSLHLPAAWSSHPLKKVLCWEYCEEPGRCGSCSRAYTVAGATTNTTELNDLRECWRWAHLIGEYAPVWEIRGFWEEGDCPKGEGLLMLQCKHNLPRDFPDHHSDCSRTTCLAGQRCR